MRKPPAIRNHGKLRGDVDYRWSRTRRIGTILRAPTVKRGRDDLSRSELTQVDDRHRCGWADSRNLVGVRSGFGSLKVNF